TGVANEETGTIIQDNKIVNMYEKGIYCRFQNPPQVIGNTVSTIYNNGSYEGIRVEGCNGVVQVKKNCVTNSPGTGFYLYNWTGGVAGSEAVVADNFAAASGNTGGRYGIYLSTVTLTNVFFNSVAFANTTPGTLNNSNSAFTFNACPANSIRMANNI